MHDPESVERARQAVRPLAQRLDVEARLREFADHRFRADDNGHPILHLEDVSGIPFVSLVAGVAEYQHRARVRAGDGDLFVAVTPQSPGFDEYCRTRLGLGSPDFVCAAPGAHPYAVAQACQEGQAFEQLVAYARRAGGLTIHPYMAIESVWELADKLSREAAVAVHVLGPPPPVLWIANDKSRFSEVVREVLSDDWLVETHTARDPRGMAEHLLRLAERHGTGGLKRTRCASAMGNAVFDLKRIASMPQDEIVSEIRRFLERTEWAVDEEVLVVAWEETDESPSTQLWIPPLGQGPPRIDGVYEQLLQGQEKIFLGSRPSRLAPEINRILIDASVEVAAGLQALGYVGRCSFDFILVADEQGRKTARFTECNGRWGGTSTPMRLVDRLVSGARPSYWAQDLICSSLIGVAFPEILRRVGQEALFDRSSGRGHYVFYNVGPLERHGKLDVIALAETPDAAEALIREDLPRRLGIQT